LGAALEAGAIKTELATVSPAVAVAILLRPLPLVQRSYLPRGIGAGFARKGMNLESNMKCMRGRAVNVKYLFEW